MGHTASMIPMSVGRPSRTRTMRLALVVSGLLCCGSAAQGDPVTVGYRDFSYGLNVTSAPTSEKPESKLWWNDAIWWGSLWNVASARYEIYRFDRPSQTWSSTGTAIDTRKSSKADCLWDGTKLYVA